MACLGGITGALPLGCLPAWLRAREPPPPRGEPGAWKAEAEASADAATDLASTTVSSAFSIASTLAPAPSSRFCDVLDALDVLQLLGFCAPRALVALRATACLGGRGGLLDTEEMRALVSQYLKRCPGLTGASLHEAADEGHLEAVWSHLFLGRSPNDYDVHGCVPLHYAANSAHAGVCRTLLRANADVHALHTGRNIRAGWTPLHFAAYAGARDALLLLLLNGAEANRMDLCRRTPLFYASSRGRDACVRLLTTFGGVAHTHLVESNNLATAQTTIDEDNVGANNEAAGQWDASGADGAALDAWGEPQDATADDEPTHREAESTPFPRMRYMGPAGDVGMSLTDAAVEMPGFEW